MSAVVEIVNQSEKNIKYLHLSVEGDEMLLLFDLPPKFRTYLKVHAQTADRMGSSWLYGSGQFADGTNIKDRGVNFRLDKSEMGGARYAVSITDTGVTVSRNEPPRN